MTDVTDLVQAVRDRLAGITSVTDLVRTTDPIGPWVFPNKPFGKVETTGERGIVVYQRGQWALPNQHNTARFPRILIESYADVDRSSGNDVEVPNAEDKARELASAVNAVMHCPQGTLWVWNTVTKDRVIGSLSLGEAETFDVPETDGMVVARQYFGLSLG